MAVIDTIREVPVPSGRAHATETEGRPQGARVGARFVRWGRQRDGVVGSVLVAPSLLLTTRDVVTTATQARGLAVDLAYPHRAAGRAVALDPGAGFVTSPVLGWTLVAVVDRGLPVVRVRQLSGMALPPVDGGARTGRGLRWVEGRQLVADIDLRLRVMGGRGDRLRAELGL